MRASTPVTLRLAREVKAVTEVAAVVGHPQTRRLLPGDRLALVGGLGLAVGSEMAWDDASGHDSSLPSAPLVAGGGWGGLGGVPEKRGPPGAASARALP